MGAGPRGRFLHPPSHLGKEPAFLGRSRKARLHQCHALARGCFLGVGGRAGGWDAASSGSQARGSVSPGVCPLGWRDCSQPLRTSNCTSPALPVPSPAFLSFSLPFLPSSGPVAPSPSKSTGFPSRLPPCFSHSSSFLALRSEIRLTSPGDPHVISRPVLREPPAPHLSSPPPYPRPQPPAPPAISPTSIFTEEFEKSYCSDLCAMD